MFFILLFIVFVSFYYYYYESVWAGACICGMLSEVVGAAQQHLLYSVQ